MSGKFSVLVQRAGRRFRAVTVAGKTGFTASQVANLYRFLAKRPGRIIATHSIGGDAATAIITTAFADLGQHESPPDSNGGPYVMPILEEAHCGQPAAWCCAAATHWVNKTAHSDGRVRQVLATSGCRALREWAQAHGLWEPHPQKGFIFLMPNDEHAGIVTGVASDLVTTIAGNTSLSDGSNYNGGNVAVHSYPINAIAGYVRTY